MNASKLIIDPETLKSNLLTPSQKRELRRKLIIDYIKAKPYGHPTSIKGEIAPLIRTAHYSGAADFVKRMLRDGLIEREPDGKNTKRGYIYTVPEPVETRKLEAEPQEAPVVETTQEPDCDSPEPPRLQELLDPTGDVLALVRQLQSMNVDFDIRISSKSKQGLEQ